MNDEDRDELLVRYLDGNVSPADMEVLNALLKADAEARGSLREMTMQALGMADLARERAARSPVQVRPEPQRTRSWWKPAVLASASAAAALTVLAVFLWPRQEQAETVTLAQVSGAVSWTTEGGQAQRGLSAGASLRGGTVVLEGSASSAQLVFADGSALMLSGECELQLPGGEQKRLTLRRGALMADIRPQKADKPMVIRTAAAEVEVLGTRFLLTSDVSGATLAVESGRVRLRRLADDQSVEVAQGQVAVASLNTSTPLVARQLPPAPAQWRATFESPPSSIWKGEYLPPEASIPGRLRNVPDFSVRRADGTPIAAYTVNVLDNSGSIASVWPDSVLRVRFRTQGKHEVLALVGLHHPAGGFAGNFQTLIRPGMGRTDASGWRTWEAPLSALEGKFPNRAQIAPGSRVFLVYLACYSPDARLEVAEVAIESPLPEVLR